ncbi:hypothetical protein PRO82_000785, partial [Candidatus Protochlamydia amoebophila]|uniref:hypothetical protein n=1 Tax=Candidatus Protochlamydia amoebophila TaxID=362787 RepID=UPI001BC9A137
LFFAPFAFFFFEAFWPTARDLPWYPHKATYEFAQVFYLKEIEKKISKLSENKIGQNFLKILEKT